MSELISEKISRLFARLIFLIMATFILGMLVYGGTFSFWNSAFSDLGSTVTPEGNSNMPACVVFMAGMVLSGLTLLRISNHFVKEKGLTHHKLKAHFSLLGGIGCFVFIFPHNINNDIHMVGAALFVAAIWSLGTLLLIESRKTVNRERNILLQTILQSTVISYAITFFANLPVKNIAQKFAVFGLTFVLRSVTALRTKYEIRRYTVSNFKNG